MGNETTDSRSEKLLDLQTQPGGEVFQGKRLNNIPWLIVLGVAVSFLIMIVYVANMRNSQQQAPESAAKTESASQAGGLEMARKLTAGMEGLIPALQTPEERPQEAPPKEKKEENKPSVPVASTPNLNTPPTPGALKDIDIELLMRVRAAKLQQFEEAIQAKTGVEAGVPRRSPSLGQGFSGEPGSRDEILARIQETRSQLEGFSNDPAKAYMARLQALKSSGMIPSGDGADGSAGGAPAFFGAGKSAGKDYSAFAAQSGEDRWSMDSRLSSPAPFMLRAGAAIIPAVLISGINSELPGQVQAQVSQDVYDTPTGKHLLIPQGTRLSGQYGNDVAYGQERVMMAWQRLIFPDGRALDLGAMPGADSSGYSGFHDQVDTHFFKAISSAFLMSGVIAGVSLSQQQQASDSGGDSQRAGDALSEALGQTMGNTLMQMLSKNLNLAPTLTIRPGYRLNVMVAKDMVFPGPYRKFRK